MSTDYDSLRKENLRRYGEDWSRIGPMLLAQRYEDRTHFIYELLQNAEDALRRNKTASRPKSVRFRLGPNELIFSHFGQPFTALDVQFICGIAESSKDHEITDIGRFGIGFKSVFAFTESPEIHSGDEHFAIDSFVWPRQIDPNPIGDGETVFRFRFREADEAAHAEIAAGLSSLGLETLLFLREIDQIEWQIEGGAEGNYLREDAQLEGALNYRRVTLLGQTTDQEEALQKWHVFKRPVFSDGTPAGQVELAFRESNSNPGQIDKVENSTLAVYFPTIVPTHFGAVLQGPYRTTPSRDNIPKRDPWNQSLVNETAILIKDALEGLKGLCLLDTAALHALPIHRTRFTASDLFSPLYVATAEALKRQNLLPCGDEIYKPASRVKLAGTKEVRELLAPGQLGLLFGDGAPLYWLKEDVTLNRTPELRQYLLNELGITEVEPETLVARLSEKFLLAQDNDWLARLYAFLLDKDNLWRRTSLKEKPIIRLSDGRHVKAFDGNRPQAFLPNNFTSGFPTVHPAICANSEAVDFLKKIGLTEPDPVDAIVEHLLPKFGTSNFWPSEAEYAVDFQRILEASKTNLKNQREKLITALRETPFVAAKDANSGLRSFVTPGLVYLATERLRSLFASVSGILLVDSQFGGLRGKDTGDLLEACGCAEYLVPEPIVSTFTPDQLREFRNGANVTSNEKIKDQKLRGLDALLNYIAQLTYEEAVGRCQLLWEALNDVQDRRGTILFFGTYKWFYHTSRSCSFDAAFLRSLKSVAWIPTKNRKLELPRFVIFEEISPAWKDNAFLLSVLDFKPRLEVELAAQVGIDPGVLDLLKKMGVTSESKLREALGMAETPSDPNPSPGLGSQADDAIKGLLGNSSEPTAPVGSDRSEVAPGKARNGGGASSGSGHGATSAGNGSHFQGPGLGASGGGPARTEFHSYVAVSSGESSDNFEGLSPNERLDIEEKAIVFIIQTNSRLNRTPPNNPGFDLYEGGSEENPELMVEVKSRKGPWTGPVALSSTQFHKAQEAGANYWLYVVENVGEPTKTRIYKIQDPAGRAGRFSFDRGWSAIAASDNSLDPESINP